jgi:hypothetical protein
MWRESPNAVQGLAGRNLGFGRATTPAGECEALEGDLKDSRASVEELQVRSQWVLCSWEVAQLAGMTLFSSR